MIPNRKSPSPYQRIPQIQEEKSPSKEKFNPEESSLDKPLEKQHSLTLSQSQNNLPSCTQQNLLSPENLLNLSSQISKESIANPDFFKSKFHFLQKK